MNKHTLALMSWNVRGLGHSSHCDDVLAELIAQRPTLVALQETKIQDLTISKARQFLPSRLLCFETRASNGASGGILTAWDQTVCTMISSEERTYSLTTCFSLVSGRKQLHCHQRVRSHCAG